MNYRKSYCYLFNQITDLIEQLKEIQIQAEELWRARHGAMPHPRSLADGKVRLGADFYAAFENTSAATQPTTTNLKNMSRRNLTVCKHQYWRIIAHRGHPDAAT